MAVFNALNYAKAYVNVPSEKIAPGEVGGELQVAYDEYTFTANAAVNDVIRLGIKIPAGARIHEAVVIAPSLGTTGTFALGTASNTTSLIAAANAGGQAVKALTPAGAADLGKELSEDTFYQLTCTVATTAAAGLKIQVWVIYTYI
jgi:hypothetical protein